MFTVSKELVPRVLSKIIESVSEELSRLMQCVSSFSKNGALQVQNMLYLKKHLFSVFGYIGYNVFYTLYSGTSGNLCTEGRCSYLSNFREPVSLPNTHIKAHIKDSPLPKKKKRSHSLTSPVCNM